MSVGGGQATLDSVIITDELDRRPQRTPDYEADSRSLAALTNVMSHAAGSAGADQVLQELVETALTQCRAGSAGVSLLEQRAAGSVLRWRVAAGRSRDHLGESTVLPDSPSGVVIARNATVLMSHPYRHFDSAIDGLPVAEVLLVPFHSEGRPVGTVWVVAHDDDRHFDNEDRRVVTRLAHFAAAA